MLQQRPIEVVDYDPQWPQHFEAIRSVLSAALGDLALAVEHVGSTSVPGLAAKPILDIDVVIASVQQLPPVISALSRLGYHHRGDLGIAGREAFGREDEAVPHDGTGRTWPHHHLYVCSQDSAELARHLLFRDYLKNNPEAARAYEQLKRELAARFAQDREAYNQGKTEFVQRIYQQIFG